MSHPNSGPTRTLPAQPSLAQLRKQAKELLKSYRAGNDAAVAEVERFEWKPDPAKFALADAQRVLARSYGFSSWPNLKEHVEGINIAAFSAAVEAGDVAAVRKLAKARPELVNTQGSTRSCKGAQSGGSHPQSSSFRTPNRLARLFRNSAHWVPAWNSNWADSIFAAAEANPS